MIMMMRKTPIPGDEGMKRKARLRQKIPGLGL